MDPSTLRAWWWHRQGLDGTLAAASSSPAAVLARAGWSRSVGGSGPYLTLFARARVSRESADAAVAALDIHELPAARGCTYVVPAADYALALKMGEGADEAEWKTAAKLGVTAAEIDKLCDAVLRALAAGPCDPAALKDLIGPAARSLGPEGVKKGLANTLPLALGRLQLTGHIRRIPVNGRLDQQRYKYALWSPNPLASSSLTRIEALTEAARCYFRWIGPATLADFQWFSGLGVKAARDILAPLGLVPLDESANPRLLFPDDLDALRAFRPPRDPQYALLSSLDSLALLRRDLPSLLDPADLLRAVPTEKGAKAMGGLADLPTPAILDRGRVIGLWEYDTATESIAWLTFDAARNKQLESAVAETEAFIRAQLGDARSFSLDSPKSRAPRIQALRAGL